MPLASLLFSAITEPIKHPFETPWTSAGLHPLVGSLFYYFRYCRRKTGEDIKTKALAGDRGGGSQEYPMGHSVLPGVHKAAGGLAYKWQPPDQSVTQVQVRGQGETKYSLPSSSHYPLHSGNWGDWGAARNCLLGKNSWTGSPEKHFFFFFWSALSISGIRGPCQGGGSEAELVAGVHHQ